MKTLFVNKKNEVVFSIESHIKIIKIDFNMLKYLLCLIIESLHDNQNQNLNLLAEFISNTVLIDDTF
jgi:hypothetical protein